MGEMTSNLPSDKQEPTLDEMLEAAESLMRCPVPIGHLYGKIIHLNAWDRTLSIGDSAACSVDHPYLVGTKIRDAALRYLGEK
jgi:hypothetical protein